MYVKPVQGRTVPDPSRGDALPPEGRDVPDNQYWQRRLIDGDVEQVTPPKPEKTPTKQTAPQTE